LTALIRVGADISTTVGFLLAEGTATVAKRFPNEKFAIVDYSVNAPPFANAKGKVLFKNVVGLTFATNENSYMIGCLSALMARKEGGKTISAVGGISIPTVNIFIAAYRAGAKKCVPGTQTLINFSQDFGDQAKCKELALDQIDRGSKVVFQVAGGCGLGALDAAKERSVWGIGVDADQSFLGDHVLTSALKRVDSAVFLTIKSVIDGDFNGGANSVYGLEEDGVGLGPISPEVTEEQKAALDEVKQKIVSGEISDIPTEVS
jgi:basic membrane protein A